jgi:hypothetical protein
VVYQGGMVNNPRESKMLPATTIEAADLPQDVLALLDDPSSTLAARMATPRVATQFSTTSYGSSTIRATWRSSSTTAPILLFTTDEAVRRIHQVCCRLDDLDAERVHK